MVNIKTRALDPIFRVQVMEKHDNVNFKVVDAAQLENVEGLIGHFLAPGAYQVQKSDDGDVNRGFLSRAFYIYDFINPYFTRVVIAQKWENFKNRIEGGFSK